MSQKDFLFDHHIVNGVYPVADFVGSAPATTDWISLANYGRVTFYIQTGVSTSNTSNALVTLNCSAVAAGSSPTLMLFKYRVCHSATTAAGDTWGALTDVATTAGFNMTAGSNYLYIIEVNAEDVEATAGGKGFVALTCTEVTNDPIVAGITVILSEPRLPQAVPVQAIA